MGPFQVGDTISEWGVGDGVFPLHMSFSPGMNDGDNPLGIVIGGIDKFLTGIEDTANALVEGPAGAVEDVANFFGGAAGELTGDSFEEIEIEVELLDLPLPSIELNKAIDGPINLIELMTTLNVGWATLYGTLLGLAIGACVYCVLGSMFAGCISKIPCVGTMICPATG